MRRGRPGSVAWLAGIGLALIAWLVVVGCGGGGVEPPPTEAPQATETVETGTPGVFEDRVLFGQSAAFSGPASELGTNMRLGIEAAFHEANEAGGVHGRRLELTSLDDAYEPEAAITNTQALIAEGVFALIGAVGTPTSRSATPVAAESGVPYLTPFTGAGLLRDPEWTNIINLRASYAQETEEMVERLTTDLGIERIAILYQDDSYGRSGFNGVQAALARRDSKAVSVGRYTRNTSAVKAAVLDIEEGNPQAVIMIGAYQPMAEFIKLARFRGMDALFLNVSFVGSNALAQELGAKGVGVLVTQVVPFPEDDSLPVVAAYQRALAAYAPEATPGFVSLEGYLAGRLAIAGLERCGRDLDRACFLASLREAEAFDIEGFAIQFGQDDNQGSDKVFLTVIGPGEQYYAIESLDEIENLRETAWLND